MNAPLVGALTALGIVGVGLSLDSARLALARHRAHRRLGQPFADVGASMTGSTVTQPLSGAPAFVRAVSLRLRDRLSGSARADRALPELLSHTARELRAGASLTAAVAAGAASIADRDPAGAGLAVAVGKGVPVAQALPDWAAQDPSPAKELAATALALAAHTGGASALVVDGVADTLRDRLAIEREVAALSSQARASAALLVVAPVAVAVLAASADERIAGFLMGSPAGWACIASGLVLDAIGAAWMRAIVARTR